MTHNFYFGKDADIVVGSASFASIIATDFASLGLTGTVHRIRIAQYRGAKRSILPR